MYAQIATEVRRTTLLVLCLLGCASILFHPEWRSLVAASYETTTPSESLDKEEEAVEERLEELREEPALNLPRWGVFATASYGETDRESRRELGYNSEVAGITMGSDYRVNNDFVLGAVVSAFDEESILLENAGTVDYKAYSYSVFGGYTPSENSYIDFLAGYTDATYKGAREANSGIIGSEYGGTTGRIALNAGYNRNEGAWTIGSLLALEYANIKNDDKVENATAPEAVRVEGRQSESLLAKIGLRVSRVFSQSWGVLSPHAALNIQHEFKDDAVELQVTNIRTGAISHFLTDKPDRDTLLGRIGMAVTLANSWNFFMSYDQLFQHEYKVTKNVNIGVRKEF